MFFRCILLQINMSRKVESGFFQCTSTNAPTVDFHMVLEYYLNNPDYVSSELRGNKDFRSMRPQYAAEAVGFVQVKREGSLCTVKAKVTPEHRVREAGYLVCVEIEESGAGSIKSCRCLDCAAGLGGCKHALALLSFLVNVTNEPSVTEVQCYWQASTLSSAVRRGECILARNIGKFRAAPVNQGRTDFRLQYEAMGGESTLAITANPYKYANALSLHTLAVRFESEDRSPQSFVQFIKDHVPAKEFDKAERLSRNQSSDSHWHELRYGRITASYVYQASRCQTRDGILAETILGAYSFNETAAIKRGKRLEPSVIKHAIGSVTKSGLIISKENPIFGASPDGLTSDAVVEIKCPYKVETVKNYMKDDGTLTPKCMAQIQLQMKVTGKKKGWFCVADPSFESNKIVTKVLVDYDEGLINGIMDGAFEFWKTSIFPKLLFQ